MLSDWQKWCRLCGKCDSNEYAVDIESLGSLNFIIQKHFSISLPETSLICNECYQFIFKIRQFAEQCERTNSMFNQICHSKASLQNDANYLQTLRSEAGMSDENFLVVEVDQLGIDNVLFAEEFNRIDDEDDKPLSEMKKSSKTQVKKEPELSFNEDAFNNSDDSADDPMFGLDEDNASNTHSDDDKKSSAGKSSKTLKSKSKTRGKRETTGKEKLKKKRKIKSKGDTKQPPKNKSKEKPKRVSLPQQLKCRLCTIDFEDKSAYNAHMRKEHKKEDRPFLCGQCPKRYETNYDLTEHETIHLPEEVRNIHECEICNKRFRTLVLVRSHMSNVHSSKEGRSFICEECGKELASKCGLREHLMSHTNNYRYQCPHCPRRFKFLARLRVHEEIHQNVTYVCPECGMQLNTKRTLSMHMAVHSETKNYKCQYCSKEYKRAKTLKIHLITHSGLRPYKCPWCEKTFSNGSNCRGHKKKAHPIELATLEAAGKTLDAVQMPTLSELQTCGD